MSDNPTLVERLDNICISGQVNDPTWNAEKQENYKLLRQLLYRMDCEVNWMQSLPPSLGKRCFCVCDEQIQTGECDCTRRMKREIESDLDGREFMGSPMHIDDDDDWPSGVHIV